MTTPTAPLPECSCNIGSTEPGLAHWASCPLFTGKGPQAFDAFTQAAAVQARAVAEAYGLASTVAQDLGSWSAAARALEAPCPDCVPMGTYPDGSGLSCPRHLAAQGIITPERAQEMLDILAAPEDEADEDDDLHERRDWEGEYQAATEGYLDLADTEAGLAYAAMEREARFLDEVSNGHD